MSSKAHKLEDEARAALQEAEEAVKRARAAIAKLAKS